MNLNELNESCISVACFTRGMDSPRRGKSSVGFWHQAVPAGRFFHAVNARARILTTERSCGKSGI